VFRAERTTAGPPAGVTFLEHTADLGLQATGPTLEACFARMGAGLFSIFAPPPRAGLPETTAHASLTAEGPEELMVAWLEELLYRSEVEGLVFSTFEVELDELVLGARLRGRPLMNGEELFGPSVKGVTRHDLAVEPGGEGWVARVVLDI
jgi:SHS2 domain-containing protein